MGGFQFACGDTQILTLLYNKTEQKSILEGHDTLQGTALQGNAYIR